MENGLIIKITQEIKVGKALEIIRNSQSYSEAYYKMIDAGFDDAETDFFWSEYYDQCGLHVHNKIKNVVAHI